MKYRHCLLHLSLFVATVSTCRRRLDMDAMLADNPRAVIHRRDAPAYEEHVVHSRGEHVIYEPESSSPKTVIILQAQAPPPAPLPPPGPETEFPSLIPRHFHKHLRHGFKFLRHRMKKLNRYFRDFLGDEEPHHPAPPTPPLPPPVPYEYRPPPVPLKIGVPAIKVEAYEPEPPKIVKVVRGHPYEHEPVIKYIEAPEAVEVVESYGPPTHTKIVKHVSEPYPPTHTVVKHVREPYPPQEIVKYVHEPHHHHDHPKEVVKYVKSHHHHHHHELPPQPPPLPPKVVRVVESYESKPPPKVVRYEESYEPDGRKVVRVIHEEAEHHHHHPREITIVTGDDNSEPIIYRERVPHEHPHISAPSQSPRRHHIVPLPDGPPPPVPTPTELLNPPEPVIYAKATSGAAQPPHHDFQPTAKAIDIHPHIIQTGNPVTHPTHPPHPTFPPHPSPAPQPHIHHNPHPIPVPSPSSISQIYHSPSPPLPPAQPQHVYNSPHHVQYAAPPAPPQFTHHQQSHVYNVPPQNQQTHGYHGPPPPQTQQAHLYSGSPQHQQVYIHPQSTYPQQQNVYSNQLFNSLPFQPDSSSIY